MGSSPGYGRFSIDRRTGEKVRLWADRQGEPQLMQWHDENGPFTDLNRKRLTTAQVKEIQREPRSIPEPQTPLGQFGRLSSPGDSQYPLRSMPGQLTPATQFSRPSSSRDSQYPTRASAPNRPSHVQAPSTHASQRSTRPENEVSYGSQTPGVSRSSLQYGSESRVERAEKLRNPAVTTSRALIPHQGPTQADEDMFEFDGDEGTSVLRSRGPRQDSRTGTARPRQYPETSTGRGGDHRRAASPIDSIRTSQESVTRRGAETRGRDTESHSQSRPIRESLDSQVPLRESSRAMRVPVTERTGAGSTSRSAPQPSNLQSFNLSGSDPLNEHTPRSVKTLQERHLPSYVDTVVDNERSQMGLFDNDASTRPRRKDSGGLEVQSPRPSRPSLTGSITQQSGSQLGRHLSSINEDRQQADFSLPEPFTNARINIAEPPQYERSSKALPLSKQEDTTERGPVYPRTRRSTGDVVESTIGEAYARLGQEIAAPLYSQRGNGSEFSTKPGSFYKRGRVISLQQFEENTDPRSREPVYTTIRRMVVIKQFQAHCLCLPIFTYSGQACMKPGLKPNEVRHHSVIHMVDRIVRTPDQEARRGLCNREIAVVPARNQTFDHRSRLCFIRTHTVDFNQRVQHIGDVHQESMPHLIAFFRAAMDSDRGS